MPREQLLGLAAEVDRLVAAGAGTAVGNDKLRQRGRALRELGKQVPALLPVADGVDRLTQATSKQATAGLLELLGMTRQVRASLAAGGVPGEATGLPASGPWRTPLPVREVSLVAEALGEAGSGREQVLRDAAERKALGDLRLVPVLLNVLESGAAGLADKIVKDALPLIGPALLPELRAKLNLQGDTVDARRLEAICRIDPLAGAALCRQALADGSVPVRVRAIECLPDVGKPGEAEKVGLQLVNDKDKKVRLAALSALRTATSAEALTTLLTTLIQTRDRETSERASDALMHLPHLHTVDRVLHELQAHRQGYEQVVATIAKLKKSRTKAAPAPKKGGKSAKTPLQEAEESKQHIVNNLCWLVGVLGQRKGTGREVAADAVLPLIHHPEEDVSNATFDSLMEGATATPRVLSTLVALVAGKNQALADWGGTVLGEIAPAQREPIIPELLKLALQAEPYQLKEIIPLLPGHFRSHGKEILPLVRSALKNKDEDVRDAAAEALGAIGPEASQAVPDVMAYGLTATGWWHDSITPRIDPEGKQAIPRIVQALGQTKGDKARRWLLHELMAYGSTAKEAAPALATLAKSKSSLGSFAQQVLETIQG